MSVLSYRASETHLEIIQTNYNIEQEQAAMQAIKNNNYSLAVHHYKNLVESSSNPKSIFVESKGIWTWSFPFVSEILIKIKAHSDPQGIGKKRNIGFNHGKLAYALEKNNMANEAMSEWQKTMQMFEMENIDQVKKLIYILYKSET